MLSGSRNNTYQHPWSQLNCCVRTKLSSQTNSQRSNRTTFSRRGKILLVKIDGLTEKTESLGSPSTILRRTKFHLAGFKPRSADSLDSPNFSGSLQHVVINGQDLLELQRRKLRSKSESSLRFEESALIQISPTSFTTHGAYIGLPQLKAFYDLNIHFQLRTLEPNGLIMFNAGQGADFLAVELVEGHIHLVFNLGKRSIELKDNYPGGLNNNQWHGVTINRKLFN